MATNKTSVKDKKDDPIRVYITAAALNVRKEPSIESKVIDVLTNTGEKFYYDIEAKTYKGLGSSKGWGKLIGNKKEGYISLDYVKKFKD